MNNSPVMLDELIPILRTRGQRGFLDDLDPAMLLSAPLPDTDCGVAKITQFALRPTPGLLRDDGLELNMHCWRLKGGMLEALTGVGIGRGPRNVVQLNHQEVSANHARIKRKDGSLFIKDLGSANGTCVNGTRLVAYEPVVLTDWDQIIVGPAVLVYLRATSLATLLLKLEE